MILDITKEKLPTKNYLQNIKYIIQTYGEEFHLKVYDLVLPVVLYKKQILTDKSFYTLEYNIKKHSNDLLPFMVMFDALYLPDTVYIANFHKSKTETGSEIINFTLKFLKYLGVKYVNLYDGAQVDCDKYQIRLSLYKLLEKKRTFYERYGFKMCVMRENKLINNNIKLILDNLVDEFRKITTKEYITFLNKLDTILKDHDSNLSIEYNTLLKSRQMFMVNEKDLKIFKFKNSYISCIKALQKTNKKLLYKALLKLNCENYVKLIDLIFKNGYKFFYYNNDDVLVNPGAVIGNNIYQILNRVTYKMKL
jgi:hypothetical protein